jgi:hypothetical protein
MAYTAITGADKKATEELVVAVPADEISALNKTDFPVADVVALLHLDAGNVYTATRICGWTDLVFCSRKRQ